jgi:hypothetical protein
MGGVSIEVVKYDGVMEYKQFKVLCTNQAFFGQDGGGERGEGHFFLLDEPDCWSIM